MYYDIEKITENANAYDVAVAIGMDVISKGGRNYIYCPGHIDRLGKMDNTPKNAILTNKGYHCFACGVTVNLFQMVQEYYKNYLGTELTFSEILEIVADTCGGREMYTLSKKDYSHSKKEFVETFILSKEELSLIGIFPQIKNKNYLYSVPKYSEDLIQKQYQEKRYFLDKTTNDFDSEYIIYSTVPYSIYSFYQESEGECIKMLLEKTNEKIEFLRSEIDKVDNFEPNLILHNNNYDEKLIVENMKNILLRDYFKCREIKKKLEVQIEEKNNDDIFLFENMYELSEQGTGPF